MLRVLFFFIFVILLSLGASHLIGLNGDIVIDSSDLFDKTIIIKLPAALFLFFVLNILVTFFIFFLFYLLVLPKKIFRSLEFKRSKRGVDVIRDTLVAIQAGEVRSAMVGANQATHFLGKNSLALLLKAQAYLMSGNKPAALQAYNKMLDHKETRLAGLRGLYLESKNEKDLNKSMYYAEEAYKISPTSDWVTLALLDINCDIKNWKEAGEILHKRTQLGFLAKDVGKRQKAVLMAAAARELEDTDAQNALKMALDAHSLAPNLVQAALTAARVLVQKQQHRKASKIIERTWSLHPHFELARIYISMDPSSTVLDRCSRAKYLAERSNYSLEGRQALAKTYIDAREYEDARKVLEPLLADIPTVNVCLLMAAIEHSQYGSEGAARIWISKAAHAPRDPVWIADGVISEIWEPVSPVTGRIDAFVWKSPNDQLDSHLTLGDDPILGSVEEQVKAIEQEKKEPVASSPALVSSSVKQEEVPLEKRHKVEDVEGKADELKKPAQSQDQTETIGEKVAEEEDTKHLSLPTLTEIQDHSEEKDKERNDNKTDEVFMLSHLPDDPGEKGDGLSEAPKTRKKIFGLF